MRSGLWPALYGGHARGGRTYREGQERYDLRENSRLGVTASFPLPTRHGLKVSAATGVATRIGADFDTFVVAYQVRLGGPG
jgi:hypothetical protein